MADRHDWDLTVDEAKSVQRRLAASVVEQPLDDEPKTVAGADVSYDLGSDVLFAAVVVLDIDTLEVVEIGRAIHRATIDYIPGLLSFREAPAILAAYDDVDDKPDVLIVDGHGRAHPRRLGIASHVGVLLDTPTVGCAKKRLTGRHQPVDEERGSVEDLVAGGDTIGQVLRTRTKVKPVFVSPGHLITQTEATELVLQCAPRYRLPETTRTAHNEVNRMRREANTA